MFNFTIALLTLTAIPVVGGWIWFSAAMGNLVHDWLWLRCNVYSSMATGAAVIVTLSLMFGLPAAVALGFLFT